MLQGKSYAHNQSIVLSLNIVLSLRERLRKIDDAINDTDLSSDKPSATSVLQTAARCVLKVYLYSSVFDTLSKII